MCDCVRQVNEKLKASNGRLTVVLGIMPEMGVVARLLLGVEKANKSDRRKPPSVSATFCPFCGSKLNADVLAPPTRTDGATGDSHD